MTPTSLVPLERVERTILIQLGRRVNDSDLAALYGVTVSRLNEQVKRNIERFPEDSGFQLAHEEFETLTHPQIAISRTEWRGGGSTCPTPSQSTARSCPHSKGRGGRRYLFTFTEQGGLAIERAAQLPCCSRGPAVYHLRGVHVAPESDDV